jgi:hypothetical protein
MKRLFAITSATIICFSLFAQSQRPMPCEAPHLKQRSGISLQDARYRQLRGARMGAQSIVIDPFSYDAIVTSDWGGTFNDNTFVDLNTNFQDSDQSLTFSMTWAAQIFDTLLDINTLSGYSYNSTPVHLDSVGHRDGA